MKRNDPKALVFISLPCAVLVVLASFLTLVQGRREPRQPYSVSCQGTVSKGTYPAMWDKRVMVHDLTLKTVARGRIANWWGPLFGERTTVVNAGQPHCWDIATGKEISPTGVSGYPAEDWGTGWTLGFDYERFAAAKKGVRVLADIEWVDAGKSHKRAFQLNLSPEQISKFPRG